MGKKDKAVQQETPAKFEIPDVKVSEKPISLSAVFSKRAVFQHFNIWLVGDTPLITHAWSFKAKEQMLQKQLKATKAGKEARNPEQDFVDSLYDMGEDKDGLKYYGFPVTGIKQAIANSAHKDKGIARSAVYGALQLDADMVRVRPALNKAICDMPLVRIYGGSVHDEDHGPEMREDMVKIGAGLNKTANLSYRAQFTAWGILLKGKFNATVLTPEALAFLITEAGMSCGLGEWRNERKGVFGAFHLATPEEEIAWDKFAKGKGPLPVPASYQLQQAAE